MQNFGTENFGPESFGVKFFDAKSSNDPQSPSAALNSVAKALTRSGILPRRVLAAREILRRKVAALRKALPPCNSSKGRNFGGMRKCMIKDFGLKIFNGSQNFYVKCGLGAAKYFTAPCNFVEAEACFNARNFNAQISRSATGTAARCFNAEANSNGTRNSAVAHNPASIRTRAATQNFSAQNSTVSRNFAAIKARLAAQNLSLAPSRHTQVKSGPARSYRRALDGSNALAHLVMSPCRVRIKFAFAAPPRQTWIKLTVLLCRAQIKLARADKMKRRLN